MPKKNDKNKKPKVHEDLEGFDMRINEFGEIVSNFEVDRINSFLDKNVKDKKFIEKQEEEPKSEEEE